MVQLSKQTCSLPDCNKSHKALGFCGTHYWRFKKHGDPHVVIRPNKTKDWILQHLDYSGADCLEWPYGKSSTGYGMAADNGVITAPRLMCILAHGAPPYKGAHAAHSCGNRGCVNPNHLRWATPKENNRDKVAHNTSSIGERNARSKLTERDVLEIRRLRKTKSLAELAAAYDVSESTISRAARGNLWSHVTQLEARHDQHRLD